MSKYYLKHYSKHYLNALCIKALFKYTMCQSTIQSTIQSIIYQSICVWLGIGSLYNRMTKLRSILKKFKLHSCMNLNLSSYELESENIYYLTYLLICLIYI